MKKLITAAALLATASSFAVSEADSWSEIRNEVKNSVKLTMSGDIAFVGQIVSVFNVCVDGDNLVTTKKYPYYKTVRVTRSRDNDGDNDGWTQVVAGYRTLSYPLTTTQYREECNNRDKNCKKVPYTSTQSTVKNISVKKFVKTVGRNNDRDVYKTLFTKQYEIPACN